MRVAGAVLGCIPAARGQIESSDEGEAVVDNDDLLMMRTGERMGVVEPEVDVLMRLPCKPVDWRVIAIGPVDHWVVPVEHPNPQLAALFGEAVQEISESAAGTAIRIDPQRRAAIEIPGEDQLDRRARSAEAREYLEIRLRIDDERYPIGAGDRTTILLDPE